MRYSNSASPLDDWTQSCDVNKYKHVRYFNVSPLIFYLSPLPPPSPPLPPSPSSLLSLYPTIDTWCSVFGAATAGQHRKHCVECQWVLESSRRQYPTKVRCLLILLIRSWFFYRYPLRLSNGSPTWVTVLIFIEVSNRTTIFDTLTVGFSGNVCLMRRGAVWATGAMAAIMPACLRPPHIIPCEVGRMGHGLEWPLLCKCASTRLARGVAV